MMHHLTQPFSRPAPAPDPFREEVPSMGALLRALAALDQGDEWAKGGDRERALAAYGEALDLYLAEGLPVIAASVAQRMIRRFPDVVRARLTLAVLSLTEGLRVLSPAILNSCRPDFEAYVRAAREAGREEMAARQLRAFAEATESSAVREQISELLQVLGDARGAECVFVAAYEEREGIRTSTPLAGPQPERWFRLLATH